MEHRKLSFVRDYSYPGAGYKEESGYIKDEIYSWSLLENSKSYSIESAYENKKHRLYTQTGYKMVFDYHCKSVISIDGFFYNIFDCKDYEWVERIYDSNFYICRRNEKYGVIDGDKNVMIIDNVYPLITRLPKIVDIDVDELFWYESPQMRDYRKKELCDNTKPYIILKISTYDGEYLLELTTKHKSKLYDKIYTFGKNYLIENGGLYGILSPLGEEIAYPQFNKAYPFDEVNTFVLSQEYRNRGGWWIQAEFNGVKVPIANNGKFYGEIPLNYEECFCVGNNYYKVKRNGKYGIVRYSTLSGIKEITPITYDDCNLICDNIFKVRMNNKYGIVCYEQETARNIIPINFDSIILYNLRPFYNGMSKNKVPFCYAIVQDKNKFRLFNMCNGLVSKEYYQSLKFTFNRGYGNQKVIANCAVPFIIAQKEGFYALLSKSGEKITDYIYQSISEMKYGVFPVCYNNKWGVINEFGEVLVECKYDKIIHIGVGTLKAEFCGETKNINLDNYKYLMKTNTSLSYEPQTYGRYAGTYAQDEAGFSDDDIDTIFEGDPSAYWNVD